MIAVLHANGMGVVQDVVLNHVIGAGSDTGAGGADPGSLGMNPFKNFRYVSYGTPATDESEDDYFSRSGRWYKNWQNFHPNSHHNDDSGDLNAEFWGPDFCYGSSIVAGDNGWGPSDNINPPGYDPPQYDHYNYIQARNWLLWYTRQTDVDGYRWDAVKHFPAWVMGSLSNEVRTGNSGLAHGIR